MSEQKFTQGPTWTDDELTALAEKIVKRRGHYRYAFTERTARNIALDILLDFRKALGPEAASDVGEGER